MLNSLHFSGKDWSKLLFWGILLSYIRLYVPYGINDTDGGFITAQAWRLCQGDLLYQQTIYVRPPLPILLRYLELLLLPENWAIWAERAFFYLKVGGYSYLGAAILYKGNRLWYMATLAFIVSVHSYPAAAWHTIDGILFSVAALYCFFRNKSLFVASVLVVAAMLCKQSFYPLALVYVVLVFLEGEMIKKKQALAGLLSALIVFAGVLWYYGILRSFLFWTGGSTGWRDVVQYGMVDYFSISPPLFISCLLLIPLFGTHRYRKYCWYLFILGLIVSFVYQLYRQQSFTVPVSQSRLLFLLGLGYLLMRAVQSQWYRLAPSKWLAEGRFFFTHGALLSVGWMAALSWGYSFPVLFALPWLALAEALTRQLEKGTSSMGRAALRGLLLLTLLLVFRYNYEFVYRDGRRSAMKYEMAAVFPKLKGIWSDRGTFEKYSELKALHQKYGTPFKTLPAFPLSNYLTGTVSPLPLDWVIDVEVNQRNDLISGMTRAREIVFLVEKEYGKELTTRPRYSWTAGVMDKFERVEETQYFYVYKKRESDFFR